MITNLYSVEELSGCCRKKTAWNIILDFLQYNKIVPQIDTIHILERNSHSLRTEWFVTLDGAPFSWVEIDSLQPEHFSVQSEAICGDFDALMGKWKLEDRTTGGITISYSLDYTLGIPVIEENCGDILKEKMHYYVNTLLKNISSRIKEHSSEERIFKRVPLNRHCSFYVDNRLVEANIVNFSRGGMLIKLVKGMLESNAHQPVEIRFSDILSGGYFIYDSVLHTHRIIFTEPMDESDFKSLFARWMDGSNLSDEIIGIYEVVTAPSAGVPVQYSKVPV